MTDYTVPPKPLPPKTRLERVTDDAEIEAIQRRIKLPINRLNAL